MIALRGVRSSWDMLARNSDLCNFHFHDLRHHFASWFVMRGGSLQALKEILGHADLKMTLRYAHLAPDHLRNEIEKTDRPTQITEGITHDITHEPVTREALSRK
jgi:integrase